MASLTASQRRARGQIGGLVAASHGSLDANLVKGRAAFAARFEREVDPERLLPMAERERRAELAKRAYFVGLAFRSSVARSRRSERRAPGRGAA